MTSGKDKKQ